MPKSRIGTMNLIQISPLRTPADVAQNCILPYRGLAVRKPCQFKDASDWLALCRMQFGDTAECNSALRRRHALVDGQALVSLEQSMKFEPRYAGSCKPVQHRQAGG